jgi:thiol-disulfide isomerase/thioredoxin
MKKMKSIKVVQLVLALLICYNVTAQIKPLKIGDKMPDIIIKNIVNHKKKELKVADFQGKLLILDFWATWCAPCVRMLKLSDSLSKSFNGEVEFLPISREPSAMVSKYLDKYNKINNLNVYSATADSIMAKGYFNITVVPTYVWVDKKGTIINITGSEEVTASNIQAVLNNQKFVLKQAKPSRRSDYRKPLFYPVIGMGDTAAFASADVTNPRYIQNLLFHSMVSGYLGDVHSAGGIFGNGKGFRATNVTIQRIYLMLLGLPLYPKHPEFGYMNRCLWKVTDTTLFHYSEMPNSRRGYASNAQWLEENLFCYELTLPHTYPANKVYELALQQINTHFGSLFGIKGSMKKEKVNCYILVKAGRSDSSFVSKDLNLPSSVEVSDLGYHSTNSTFDEFILSVTHYQQYKPPIINETGFQGKINLNINCTLKNIDLLNIELKKYGLELRPAERILDMIVVEDI